MVGAPVGSSGAAAPQAIRDRLSASSSNHGPKGGTAPAGHKLWRIHSAFDLPAKRSAMSNAPLCLGVNARSIPVVEGEIRITYRAYLQPYRIAVVREEGADVLIRAAGDARWLHADGEPSIFSPNSQASPRYLSPSSSTQSAAARPAPLPQKIPSRRSRARAARHRREGPSISKTLAARYLHDLAPLGPSRSPTS